MYGYEECIETMFGECFVRLVPYAPGAKEVVYNAFKMGRWISRECLPSQLQTSEEILKDLVKTAKSDNTYKHECSESRRMT
ncbi:hypothetical protein DPMN_108199 [Dreissena polymorpha]|uniref:Uncharacterized protein n=1 Tax=Dreissena polymorpha TaxID=45954 RepID=A0A9D4K8N4_DREPO|nr:hypothetical protein DPMN_108199 [Dreissena polymorpha]